VRRVGEIPGDEFEKGRRFTSRVERPSATVIDPIVNDAPPPVEWQER
jgi:hypothetical protein